VSGLSPETIRQVSRLSVGARSDLLRILRAPSDVRANAIRQFYERPTGAGIADVLIGLESDEILRLQVIDVLRQSLAGHLD
jgi:hypothetical protein